MPSFEIWSEGFLMSGMEGVPAKAQLLGVVEADTFRAACIKLCSTIKFQELHGNFDPIRLTVWACKLYDNEHAARKLFG